MPPCDPKSSSGQAGFTIIETMVASVVLLIGLVATLSLVDAAGSTTARTRTREQATNLQRELVEAARSVPYDQLTPNALGPAVRARPALGDSSLGSAGWTIQRRNATYTVAMSACTVDDPKDGIGAHQAGVFCAVSGSAADANLDGTVDGLVTTSATTCATPCPDSNPADYKRIVSLVRWSKGVNQQTSQVSNPGLAGAPAVINLDAATNSISDTRSSLDLASTTSGLPVTVALYLDGTQIGTATSSGPSAWTAAWAIGGVTATPGSQPAVGEILDGSYELSEKAFDQYGQYGATKSQTIVVNRRVPFAPEHVEAGRNDDTVEIEWSPAKERDSEGFTVYRQTNDDGNWVVACALAVRTLCRDTNPPGPGQKLKYSVVGFDRDALSALRAGDRSEVIPIPDVTPAVPASPGSLQAALLNGDVKLTWTAPAGLPAPDHYNIYRDGRNYDDRLNSAYFNLGDPLSYTDTRAGGILHDYWITAVNAQRGESVLLGPVRR